MNHPEHLSESEETALKKQVWDLRVMHSQYTHSDDKRRMVDAADVIEELVKKYQEVTR